MNKYMIQTSLLASLTLMATLPRAALADDNIAACEIVVMQAVEPPKHEEDGLKITQLEQPAMIATFYPAEDFLFSVFDTSKEFISTVDGHPIRAVMCRRNHIIPTEFDLKIIRTDIPLHLSQNFDSPDSSLLSVHKKDDLYAYQYMGTDLSKEDKAVLKLRFETLNTTRQEVSINDEK